jgi:hypothetical protein
MTKVRIKRQEKVGIENRSMKTEGWDTIEEYEDRRL